MGDPGIHRLLRIQPQPTARLSTAVQFCLTRQNSEAYNRRICGSIIEQFRPNVVFFWNLQGLPHELALDAESTEGAAVAYWLAGYTPAEPDSYWRYWTQPPGKNAYLGDIKSWLSGLALAQLRREGKPVRPRMRHASVVSEYMRDKGQAEDTLPAQSEVIYNGVETEIFYRPAPPPGGPAPLNLLLAGRVSSDKGIHVAVEAVSKLVQVRPQRDFRLLIAGDGPTDYLEHLQQMAASNCITDLVSFLGWLPRDQMPDLMHTCHILLLTSIHPEAFSRVVLEAMAAGLAVVGTLTGGTGELLQDGCNGLVCSTEDSEGMAHQINRLLDDPDLRYHLACKGQEMVLEQYSMEHMVERIEALLERAAAEQYEQNK